MVRNDQNKLLRLLLLLGIIMKTEQKEKFINYIMLDGKKHLAEQIFAEAMEIVKKKGHKNPDELLDKAFENVMPRIEVRPRRMGGSIYQVPTDVKPTRQFYLACKWILDACKSKKGRGFAEFLAQELIENAQENGSAFKKKLEVYRNADANKVNARFAR